MTATKCPLDLGPPLLVACGCADDVQRAPQVMGFRHTLREVWLVDVMNKATGQVEEHAVTCDGSGEDPACHDGKRIACGSCSILECVCECRHAGLRWPLVLSSHVAHISSRIRRLQRLSSPYYACVATPVLSVLTKYAQCSCTLCSRKFEACALCATLCPRRCMLPRPVHLAGRPHVVPGGGYVP